MREIQLSELKLGQYFLFGGGLFLLSSLDLASNRSTVIHLGEYDVELNHIEYYEPHVYMQDKSTKVIPLDVNVFLNDKMIYKIYYERS